MTEHIHVFPSGLEIGWDFDQRNVCCQCKAPICGVYNSGNGLLCTRSRGHDGEHANEWKQVTWTATAAPQGAGGE